MAAGEEAFIHVLISLAILLFAAKIFEAFWNALAPAMIVTL
jgi:hypothetical protein